LIVINLKFVHDIQLPLNNYDAGLVSRRPRNWNLINYCSHKRKHKKQTRTYYSSTSAT